MMDFDGNIFVPLSIGASLVLAILFLVVKWDTLFDKFLKVFLGVAILMLISFVFRLIKSDTSDLVFIKDRFRTEIVGTYFLDMLDSDFKRTYGEIPDTIKLILNDDWSYTLNYGNFSILESKGVWNISADRMSQKLVIGCCMKKSHFLNVVFENDVIFINNSENEYDFARLVFRKVYD